MIICCFPGLLSIILFWNVVGMAHYSHSIRWYFPVYLKCHPHLWVFYSASNKTISRRNQQIVSICCCGGGDSLLNRSTQAAPGSESTLAQHLNSCTSSAGSRWRNPQPLSAYGCLFNYLFFWGEGVMLKHYFTAMLLISIWIILLFKTRQ